MWWPFLKDLCRRGSKKTMWTAALTRTDTTMWSEAADWEFLTLFCSSKGQRAFMSDTEERKHRSGLQREDRPDTLTPPASPLTINQRIDSWLWPRTSTLGRFLSVPFQADGGVSVIGRRSGRSSDEVDSVAREREEGGDKRVRCWGGCGAWPVLIIPKGSRVLALWQSRSTGFQLYRRADRWVFFGGEVSNTKM